MSEIARDLSLDHLGKIEAADEELHQKARRAVANLAIKAQAGRDDVRVVLEALGLVKP